ncbi:MAG: ABC transporter ATP-binding protein [Bacteroidota bacterium]
MKPILEIQNISKKFRINQEQQPYLSIRDSIGNLFKSRTNTEDFWALNDVSFNVMPGESIGIIGKNGAGKSTLLKILSKITPPTSGKIISRGRIASLLEVGTGFHPELSGRENVFMNGSILGMRRAEILKNFDAIVDFAGVSKFIDTPLKHYSSGMQLRLAFAVAAFLENEILIIDEVLAVGDAEFQKKCLGKMEDVSKSGRTILFVSHNLAALKSLCTKGVCLKNGKSDYVGSSGDAIGYYLESRKEQTLNEKFFDAKYSNEEFTLNYIKIKNSPEDTMNIILDNLPIEVHTNLDIHKDGNYHISYHIKNDLDETLFAFYNLKSGTTLKRGSNNLICSIPAEFLQSGYYSLTLYIVKDEVYPIYIEHDVFSFMIVDGKQSVGSNMSKIPGYVRPKFTWSNT